MSFIYEDNPHLIVELKKLMLEKNISQKKLADAIGVSQKAIDFWERCVNEPKASYIVKLADYFEVSADYILGRNNFFS